MGMKSNPPTTSSNITISFRYPVDPYSATCEDHTYNIVSLIPPREDQCEWHRMTRMTGPDCVVMCNLINTYIHTYIQ